LAGRCYRHFCHAFPFCSGGVAARHVCPTRNHTVLPERLAEIDVMLQREIVTKARHDDDSTGVGDSSAFARPLSGPGLAFSSEPTSSRDSSPGRARGPAREGQRLLLILISAPFPPSSSSSPASPRAPQRSCRSPRARSFERGWRLPRAMRCDRARADAEVTRSGRHCCAPRAHVGTQLFRSRRLALGCWPVGQALSLTSGHEWNVLSHFHRPESLDEPCWSLQVAYVLVAVFLEFPGILRSRFLSVKSAICDWRLDIGPERSFGFVRQARAFQAVSCSIAGCKSTAGFNLVVQSCGRRTAQLSV